MGKKALEVNETLKRSLRFLGVSEKILSSLMRRKTRKPSILHCTPLFDFEQARVRAEALQTSFSLERMVLRAPPHPCPDALGVLNTYHKPHLVT